LYQVIWFALTINLENGAVPGSKSLRVRASAQVLGKNKLGKIKNLQANPLFVQRILSSFICKGCKITNK
ncbi:MAG: hypothetical protein WCK53_14690, partial [Methanomicrobiales archaeon]